MVSRRSGRELDFLVPPGHAALKRYLAPFAEWLARPGAAARAMAVETINGEAALASPYGTALQEAGFHREMKAWVLRRSY